MTLVVQLKVRVSDHIEQHRGFVRPLDFLVVFTRANGLALGVLPSEPLAAQEVGIAIRVDQLLGIEQHEVDAEVGVFRLFFERCRHQVGKLHQQSAATRPVVRSEEDSGASGAGVGVLVRQRARVVVSTQEHPAGGVGPPANDQVRHPHGLTGTWVRCLEPLVLDGHAYAFKMLLNQLLLLRHAGGSADAGPDCADLPEVAHGPVAVDWVPVGGVCDQSKRLSLQQAHWFLRAFLVGGILRILFRRQQNQVRHDRGKQNPHEPIRDDSYRAAGERVSGVSGFFAHDPSSLANHAIALAGGLSAVWAHLLGRYLCSSAYWAPAIAMIALSGMRILRGMRAHLTRQRTVGEAIPVTAYGAVGPSMRIRKRHHLLVTLTTIQFVGLLIAVGLFGMWLQQAMRSTIHEQVLADNIQTAKQLTKLVREMKIGDIRSSTRAWERMQSVVREIELPNEGYACLVDSDDGALLCHPALTTRPEFPMTVPFARELATRKSSSTIGFQFGSGDDLEIIAANEIPDLGATLLVHQRGAGVNQAIARTTAGVFPVGLLIAFVLVSSTVGALVMVTRRYDDRLAQLNHRLEERVARRTLTLRRMRDAVVFGLAKLAESRDTDTGEHLDRIRKYVTLLAEQLSSDGFNLGRQEIEKLALASSLHDIGKVGVSDRVLLKPGRLDPEERAEIETHAARGGDCLAAISNRLGDDDFLQFAKEIAYGHHEKWDGTGYPAGVSGESIPFSARIVAVADVYDALRSRRPYKEPMSHEKARAILLEGRGTHFDPVMIEAFLACEEAFYQISEQSNAASERDHAEARSVVAGELAGAGS